MTTRFCVVSALLLAVSSACATEHPGTESSVRSISNDDSDPPIVLAPGPRLRIDPLKSTGFADKDSNPIWLTGIIVAGGPLGYPQWGWPWASVGAINLMVDRGRGNYVHMRMGPFVTSTAPERIPPGFDIYKRMPDGRYDLNDWNLDFWRELHNRIDHAASRGVYVEIDLVDAWSLEGVIDDNETQPRRKLFSAWEPSNNIQGENLDCNILAISPPQRVRDYVAKIASELARHPNVVFQVGNETNDCRPSDQQKAVPLSVAFELGVIQQVQASLAAAGDPDHLIATNSATPEIEILPDVKYVNRHRANPIAIQAGKPTAVNEDDGATNQDEYMEDVWEAFTRGTIFHYWFGGSDDDATVDAVLARMRVFLDFVRSLPHRNFTVLGPHVTGIAGSQMVGFSEGGAVLTVDLGPTVKTFQVRWMDARNGNIVSTTSLTASGVQTFTPPQPPRSWVLHITSGGGGSCVAPPAGTWAQERFDELAPGPLGGQACWVKIGTVDASVVNAGNGRRLLLDPPPSTTMIHARSVPVQTAGRHRLEVTVVAVDPATPTLAKLEVNNAAQGTPYNKLFQIYAGTGLRVNYGPESMPAANVIIEPQVVSGATYRVRIDFDLGTGLMDMYVNGAPRALGVQMVQSDRRIAAIAVSGFEGPGAVYFDDIDGQIAPPPQPGLWELDTFDALVPGPLTGQNGWVASGASPIVSGGVLVVDAPPSDTIQISKPVPVQTAGRRRFSFRVRVDGGTTASMAKIELQSTGSDWGKLAQVFFGTTMRLNHSLTQAAPLVGPTVMGHWYYIELDIDLDQHRINAAVDGVPLAFQLPISVGPITGLSISGWDVPGSVTLDDLRGEVLP